MPPRLLALALVGTLAFAACGTTDAQDAAAPATVTVTAPPTTTSPANASADTTPSEPASTPPATIASKGAVAGGASGASGCVVVPDVVGKDHQLGHDTMQAAVLRPLDEGTRPARAAFSCTTATGPSSPSAARPAPA